MPLTQEKRLDNNFSNNNDHSYLHKKFKKMASTMSMLPGSSIKREENGYQETSLLQVTSSSTITNGSIAAAHPEIEKIKDIYDKRSMDVENNVQTNFNNEISRLSDVNSSVLIPGKTSFSKEFLNKTENLENDFIKETYSGGTGRYICPYCKISCAKPSVLQKHIRAHTNERPFPCIPCGFAFKTKSNLYKHRRSRTHALRLQGADIASAINDDDLSGDSESDTSIPPTSLSGSDRDQSSDTSMIRSERRPNEFSSPELTNDSNTMSIQYMISNSNDNKSKTIYKPKFRAAFYHGADEKDKIKKTISQNADFLTEHISKIISDNEAIVEDIETPLQKKYGKIKQIAESKQFLNEVEITPDATPLNLTKNCYDTDNLVRKRSHSESFAQILDDHKHPLNPEGSIIKDLLLKTKANGHPVTSELVDGLGPLYVCPLCQIIYRSADNLEVHRLYYCKGVLSNNSNIVINAQKEIKSARPENVFFRSNSINVRLPENMMSPVSRHNIQPTKSPPLKNKPDNLVIVKSDTNDIIAPLPSPGPLLGNTRLVDSRLPTEINKKSDALKIRPNKESSPKRRLDSRSETYSPRLLDNSSPRSVDLYSQPKIRCMEINTSSLRSMEEISPLIRHNSTSLQMFGGEVKILDHSGSTTTLRIEPSKTQLSPILIHQNLSPSKYGNEEASSVVVRSGLHSGGTIVHNPPTPKEIVSTPQIQPSRISVSTPNSNLLNMHDITHFQFPPLSAITAYNPLTLPPLSPSSSPNGASTILHGGKLIPHVPGIPGPNTPGSLVGSNNNQVKNKECLKSMTKVESISDTSINMHTRKCSTNNYDRLFNSKSPNIKSSNNEIERHNQNKESYSVELQNNSSLPIIQIKYVDEPVATSYSSNNSLRIAVRTEGAVKRNAEGIPRLPVLKENSNYLLIKSKIKDSNFQPSKNADNKPEIEIKNYNFENLITKVEIYNNQIQSSSEVQKNNKTLETCATSLCNERSETSYFQKNLAAKTLSDERKPKFLRPSTLPLKPGTFTPKKHHGITPNANTMPLISPETPRPAKAYGQLYLNGNAYTYLGLKCSTKVFYCTINRPQPTYVPNQHFLSMYSNWQLLSELTPDPLGLSASSAMSLYDSRHRPQNVAVAVIKQDLILTHSSQWNKNLKDNKQLTPFTDTRKSDDLRNNADNITTPKKEVTGGFESNEEYTYVRGRGRGRYVCSECGIRCKKPSMLKKHIRTHTDVRPYTCIHCVFSFKTKGNLTKHMKSKAHYKKCCELGINPNDGNDGEGVEMAQCSGETDDETDSDGDEGNEGETESSDTEIYKSRLPEHEAAHCLLSLGGSRPATSATPGLITSARPTTYPYTPVSLDSEADMEKQQPLVDSRIDVDNEPMDLSKNELRTSNNAPEIPTARESSVLASLASNTAKLPQHQSQWVNGEPLLQTYLTERALLDSKIKQSQLTCNSKSRKIVLENSLFPNTEGNEKTHKKAFNTYSVKINSNEGIERVIVTKTDTITGEILKPSSLTTLNSEASAKSSNLHSKNTENIKFLKYPQMELLKGFDESLEYESRPNTIIKTSTVTTLNSETCVTSSSLRPKKTDNIKVLKYSEMELLKAFDEPLEFESRTNTISNDQSNSSKLHLEEKTRIEELSEIKPPLIEHDSGASNVETEVTDFDDNSYSFEKLMEDEQRVCFYCKETFIKPPRPFRCCVCAVSFRTRGHLLVHERSASHKIKISMTPNSENAKQVVSEYLKHSRGSPISSDDSVLNYRDISIDDYDGSKVSLEDKTKIDNNIDNEVMKLPSPEFDPTTSKSLSEEKDFQTEEDWRDCDFCNKMFREPAQLKLHLNIHYMERPFRCSVCAASNRTKGYIQRHDLIAYNSNKITKKPNSENAKYVVSEYLKHARINPVKKGDEPLQNSLEILSDDSNANKVPLEEKTRIDENSEGDALKLALADYEGNQYDSVAPKVVIGVGGVAFKVTKGKDFEGTSYSPGKLMEDGRRVCDFCNKTFTKPSQLRLHLNIHYMERPFRCSVCAVSFRTRGHLQKHERSASHHNKVSMTSTFGAATSFNPRPFRCSDCNIAFRIHGHLAKHLRSKMHVMRLECLFKLPFGTFTEIERAGLSLTDIDTTDCASSLASLQSLARKLHEKDPTKLEYREPNGSLPALPPAGRDSSDDEDMGVIIEKTCDSANDIEIKKTDNDKGLDTELRLNYSATDNLCQN